MTAERSFPRQHARTLRFTLGAPRSFTVAPDGSRIAFLRSRSGTDRANRLWVLDLDGPAAPRERVVADPEALLGGAPEELSPAERARRERSREGAGGIVGYATDRAVETATLALSGRLFVVDLAGGSARELGAASPVFDPRPSPSGSHVAYVHHGGLRVASADGSADVVLAEPEHDDVTWGLAEFVAAEEMDRSRGFWWSPDGDRLLVARVDGSAVQRWWIADPANPGSAPTPVRYPAAGTPNADVGLSLLGLDGSRVDVTWDRTEYPYLADVCWTAGHHPVIHVQARDQRTALVLAVDPATGATSTLREEHDAAWLHLLDGVPALTPDGRLVHVEDRDDSRVLVVDGRVLTGPSLHVRGVLDVDDRSVLFSASAGEAAESAEIGEVHVYRADGHRVERVSDVPGIHGAVRSGAVTVLSTAVLEHSGTRVRVFRDGERVAEIASSAEHPVITARPELMLAGSRRIPCAVLLPSGHAPGDGPLPVLMDPYGGPHVQRVTQAQNAHLTSQWFADHGFAVVVADGRGTPGRTPGWEKAMRNDVAGVALEDQVDALQALAQRYPLDLDRVAVRGWSFGGYLAALAVLRRPDVFHAAVAGAPVSDLRLYDTHYQERYLDHPAEQPEVYARNSLVTDDGLSEAADTVRPMLIIHGLADDNVVVAHSLRLSAALLAAGRSHQVLPLSGVTHMTPQEEIAENLLLLQVDFLKSSLGMPA
ncbi:MAG TPA: prolyl oligopeptidase family serine peptidase [Nocardioidaceae bacterium]|nr:prolyl oligopeptidase family serine peptidase [Nocardioidaceae bacterium]